MTMKFGQLIEYNMGNTFVDKLCTKCDGETNSRPFSKKSKLSILTQNHTLYDLTYMLVLLSFILYSLFFGKYNVLA